MKLLALSLLLFACATARAVPEERTCAAEPWAHWSRYAEEFISPDGRVVDRTAHDRTTSEGQSYALFFALVNNDRPRFDKVLHWTEANLARGDLKKHLPSWLWGEKKGRWKVIDSNSASDSDLWIAYDLLEAGRLWQEPRYTKLGTGLLALIRRKEIANLPGLGPMLLPAPVGFELQKGQTWRLNPSYVPPQLLRRLASADPSGPWSDVLASSVRLVQESSAHGLVADWVLYQRDHGFGVDPAKGPIGSYDAIRVYLWTGMLAPEDPVRPQLCEATGGLFRHWQERGAVPEKVDVGSDEVGGHAPPGFIAALLPAAQAKSNGDAALLEQQLSETLDNGLYGKPPAYYDQNLILFAHGFVEGRFRFAADGSLVPKWGESCARR